MCSCNQIVHTVPEILEVCLVLGKIIALIAQRDSHCPALQAPDIRLIGGPHSIVHPRAAEKAVRKWAVLAEAQGLKSLSQAFPEVIADGPASMPAVKGMRMDVVFLSERTHMRPGAPDKCMMCAVSPLHRGGSRVHLWRQDTGRHGPPQQTARRFRWEAAPCGVSCCTG